MRAACGSGTITIGLAGVVAEIVGIDPDSEGFADARSYAVAHDITNVEFRVGSVYALDFQADHFDACLCHSMLEVLDRPLDALIEIERALRPGGVIGVACVEYGGLILAGPNSELLRRFYRLRERLWLLENVADPYRGRQLRGLLDRAGFDRVSATSKYLSYGTGEAVESFGLARAQDCSDDWYADSAAKHGLATAGDLAAMAGRGSSGRPRRRRTRRSPGVGRWDGSRAGRSGSSHRGEAGTRSRLAQGAVSSVSGTPVAGVDDFGGA